MLIGTGCTSILGGFSSPVWLIPLVQFINEKMQTNITIPDTNVDYIVMGTGVVIGLLLIILGLNHRKRLNKKNKKMMQIRHSSIEGVNYLDFRPNLDDYEIIPITINQYQDLKEINEFNLKMAWRKQEQNVENLVVHINDNPTDEIAYLGLAHIPYQFLLGYQVADKINVQFFEWNRTNKYWGALSNNDTNYPKLLLDKTETNQEFNIAEEVIIKVGITFNIFDSQLEGLNLENINSYCFHLDSPQTDVITSYKQLNNYNQQFRDLLTDIHHKYPKLKKVHIFISAQPSLTYSFGSVISARMDSSKEFWIYNYKGSSNNQIQYPWALKIAKNIENGEIKIF